MIFIIWGDMLLNDFDDVDKYLVDGSLLFRNVLDIKNIDQSIRRTDRSIRLRLLKRFWTNFNHDKPTEENQDL